MAVDKYALVLLIFLIGGMIIGITQVPPRLELFYAGLAGAVIIIIYSAIQNRREHQRELRRERRKGGKFKKGQGAS